MKDINYRLETHTASDSDNQFQLNKDSISQLYGTRPVAVFDAGDQIIHVMHFINLCQHFRLEFTLYGAIYAFYQYMLAQLRDGNFVGHATRKCIPEIAVICVHLTSKFYESNLYIPMGDIVPGCNNWTLVRNHLLHCHEYHRTNLETASQLEWHIFERLGFGLPQIGGLPQTGGPAARF
jgi:hypothetical protein